MKKAFLLVLFLVLGFCNFAFCTNPITYLGDKELGTYELDWLSLNNNGDQALVTFQDNKGLWIVGMNSSKKIADAPAKMGTWSPTDKLIAYVKDKDLVIADSIGNIKKELDLGLRWVDSIAWLKNEKTIYMFEGPDEFYYRLLRIDIITGKVDVILPESGNRLQLKVNKKDETQILFMNNRYPGEFPEDCGIGNLNIKNRQITTDIYDRNKYRAVFFDISSDGNHIILPNVWSDKVYIALLDIKNKRIKTTNIECHFRVVYNYNSTKIATFVPFNSNQKGIVQVIDTSILR